MTVTGWLIFRLLIREEWVLYVCWERGYPTGLASISGQIAIVPFWVFFVTQWSIRPLECPSVREARSWGNAEQIFTLFVAGQRYICSLKHLKHF